MTANTKAIVLLAGLIALNVAIFGAKAALSGALDPILKALGGS